MSTHDRRPKASKHFTSSILLWMRTDQPRQTGMDHWKGPHSGIIANTPGLEEYRQIHLAEAQSRPLARHRGRRDADSRSTGRSTASPKSPSSPRSRRWRAASRRHWLSRTRSTCSAAPCCTPVRRTRPAGTTSRPARRPARAPSSTCAAGTASGRSRSTSSSRRPGSRPHRHRRAEGTAHADVPALEREAVGHPRTSPTTTRTTSTSTPRSSSASPTRRRATTSSQARTSRTSPRRRPGRLGDPRLRRHRRPDLRQERRDPPALRGVARGGSCLVKRE